MIYRIYGQLYTEYTDNVFKGTVVNRALPFSYGGSLEITLTVPLNYKSKCIGYLRMYRGPNKHRN